MATATKERRLIVKGWEAKAILSGRKTQMRRPIDCGCNQKHRGRLLGDWGCSVPPYRFKGSDRPWNWHSGRLPVEGDWIEEVQIDVDDAETCPVSCPFGEIRDRIIARESIFVDQRIGLELVDLRVERAWEINESDAESEGFKAGWLNDAMPATDIGGGFTMSSPGTYASASGKFAIHWVETYGEESWDSNPWVWVPTFRKIGG